MLTNQGTGKKEGIERIDKTNRGTSKEMREGIMCVSMYVHVQLVYYVCFPRINRPPRGSTVEIGMREGPFDRTGEA